jgi:large subunit ribosomal protein L24
MAKRHMRPRTRTQQAGILDLPVPIHISNVQVVCPRCDKPTRLGTQTLENGRRVRVCKHCGEQIEGATR